MHLFIYTTNCKQHKLRLLTENCIGAKYKIQVNVDFFAAAAGRDE